MPKAQAIKTFLSQKAGGMMRPGRIFEAELDYIRELERNGLARLMGEEDEGAQSYEAEADQQAQKRKRKSEE